MAVDIEAQLGDVQDRIRRACETASRDPADVQLVAVSKGQPEDKIEQAYAAGQRVFGENYAHELANKATSLLHLQNIEWRFIGHLQRNKVRLVLGANAQVDSVDSVRLADAVAQQYEQRRATHTDPDDVEPRAVLIQVNIGLEPQKSGCMPADVADLVEHVQSLPALALQGLMGVPPHTENPADAAPYFESLKQLADTHDLKTVSMGMTHDLEVAVAQGATEVRIGTAIFGPRG